MEKTWWEMLSSHQKWTFALCIHIPYLNLHLATEAKILLNAHVKRPWELSLEEYHFRSVRQTFYYLKDVILTQDLKYKWTAIQMTWDLAERQKGGKLPREIPWGEDWFNMENISKRY